MNLYCITEQNNSSVGSALDTNLFCFSVADFFDDGVPAPAQAYLTVCSAMSEASLDRGNPDRPPAKQASQHQDMLLASTGTIVQRRSVLRTEEIVSYSLPAYNYFLMLPLPLWIDLTNYLKPSCLSVYLDTLRSDLIH